MSPNLAHGEPWLAVKLNSSLIKFITLVLLFTFSFTSSVAYSDISSVSSSFKGLSTVTPKVNSYAVRAELRRLMGLSPEPALLSRPKTFQSPLSELRSAKSNSSLSDQFKAASDLLSAPKPDLARIQSAIVGLTASMRSAGITVPESILHHEISGAERPESTDVLTDSKIMLAQLRQLLPRSELTSNRVDSTTALDSSRLGSKPELRSIKSQILIAISIGLLAGASLYSAAQDLLSRGGLTYEQVTDYSAATGIISGIAAAAAYFISIRRYEAKKQQIIASISTRSFRRSELRSQQEFEAVKSKVNQLLEIFARENIDLKAISKQLIASNVTIESMLREVFRDSIQNHPNADNLSQTALQNMFDVIAQTGLGGIEAVSFVNPERIPVMKFAPMIANYIYMNRGRWPRLKVSYLIFSKNGAETAVRMDPKLDQLGVAIALSPTYGAANTGSADQDRFFEEFLVPQLDYVRDVNSTIRKEKPISLRGYLSNTWEASTEDIVKWIKKFYAHGITEIALSDTTGKATPETIRQVVETVRNHPDLKELKGLTFVLHLHDSDLGLANVLAGIQSGIKIFDSSIGNLGGSPFSDSKPGVHGRKPGNISTEDLVFFLDALGVPTKINLPGLYDAVGFLEHQLNDHFIKNTRVLGLHLLTDVEISELKQHVQDKIGLTTRSELRMAVSQSNLAFAKSIRPVLAGISDLDKQGLIDFLRIAGKLAAAKGPIPIATNEQKALGIFNNSTAMAGYREKNAGKLPIRPGSSIAKQIHALVAELGETGTAGFVDQILKLRPAELDITPVKEEAKPEVPAAAKPAAADKKPKLRSSTGGTLVIQSTSGGESYDVVGDVEETAEQKAYQKLKNEITEAL